MSKAFVKETDDADIEPADDAPAIPAGVKNYMTPTGHRRMQEELRRLLRDERPKMVEMVAWAAGNGDRSENGDYLYGKKRLREIDRRIRFLTKRLETAEVVDPARADPARPGVFRRHRHLCRPARRPSATVTIVGIDEADLDRGQVSWISPIARALLKAQEGDVVELRTPAGIERDRGAGNQLRHGLSNRFRSPSSPLSRRAGGGLPCHGFSGNGAPPAATCRRRHACVAVTKLVTPTPATVNTTSTNGSPSVCRLGAGSGVDMPISAMPGKASANIPNSVKAQPPHSRVRAAVVSEMLRIASAGRPRRAAQ